MGRKAAFLTGLGAIAVLACAAFCWKPIAFQLYFRSFLADRERFTAALESGGNGVREEALKVFLATERGEEALFRELMSAILEPPLDRARTRAKS